MAVMEVGLLSSFVADKESLEELEILKRIEDGTKALNLYFQEVLHVVLGVVCKIFFSELNIN